MKSQLLDFIVTASLFLTAGAGLLQALKFPGRSGMWPTFVLVALLLFVGLHLLNLIRTRLSTADGQPGTDESGRGD